MAEKSLEMYVVYDHPIDHPNDVVVRRWTAAGGTATPGPIVARGPSLEAVRAQLPFGLYRLNRFLEDDPKIAEVWL